MSLVARILFAFALCLLSTNIAFAKPTSSKLAEIEAKVAAEKLQQEKLKAQASDLEGAMKGLKTDLIGTTEKVQKHENNLRDLEERLTDVGKQKETLANSLLKDKASLANLILALERIRRLPPETLIARPDAPLETAQAATVLATLLPEVNRRAEKLKENLAGLQALEEQLKDDQASVRTTAEKLKAEKGRMQNLMAERAKSLEETRKAVSAQETKIANLSKEAKDFRELIEKIEKRRQEQQQRNTTTPRHQKLGNDGVSDASLPAMGTGRPPVSGLVKTRYGQRDDIGATSQGLTFTSHPGAVVVAPMGGIVRYAGDFRNYGQIILLEHKNKFHSLVAGLGKIDTFVGQHVDAGEPLGYLPPDSGRLYYELRYKGEPVNPSQKFENLN